MENKSILEKNLAALIDYNQAASNAVAAFEGEGITLEVAKSGDCTFRYRDLYFHSCYEPRKEAELQCANLLVNKTDWIVLFGLGCGYLLETLVKERRDHERGARVIVFEPSMEILKGVLEAIDLSEYFSEKEVFLFTDLGDFSELLSTYVDGVEDVMAFQTMPYKQVFPKDLIEFTNKTQNARIISKVYIKTDITSRLMWLENYFNNIGSFFKYPDIGVLQEKFKGIPAVIVGAGPSLAKNAHLLRELRGRVLIIAAVTAYKPLLGYGVTPDFIIAAEKIDLAEYFTGGEEDGKVRLILADVSHPNMMERDAKGKFTFVSTFMKVSVKHAELWGVDFFPSIGGSVTTTALGLAVDFGCDPVIMIGQDLAFGESGTHIGGTVYSEQKLTLSEDGTTMTLSYQYETEGDANWNEDFKVLWLKGQDGERIASKFDWVTFHKWFEEYMKCHLENENSTRIINATEGGAFIEGMEHITLKEAIESFIKEEKPIEDILMGADREMRSVDLDGLFKAYEDMAGSLGKMKKMAENIVKNGRKALKIVDNSGLTNELSVIIEKISSKEHALFDESSNVIFMWETVVDYIYELKEYLREDVEHGTVEQFQKDLESVIKTYTRIRDTSVRFIPVMNHSIEIIKDGMA